MNNAEMTRFATARSIPTIDAYGYYLRAGG
jgi:hypothetical protein